jgi:hypothetical protein
MRLVIASVLAGLLLLPGGCTGIQSVIDEEGIVYHLPRTVLTVTVIKYRDTVQKRTWYQIGSLKKFPKLDLGEVPELAEIKGTSVPDPGHRYVAQYNPNPFSDDRLCVSRSTTGLLQDVNFASDDRTPQIFFNIARFIAGSLGGERKTGASFSGDIGNRIEWELHTGRVDPLNADSVAKFEESLAERFGEPLTLDVLEMERILKASKGKLPTGCRWGHCAPEKWTDRCIRDNICYRTALNVPIGLKRNGRHVDTNYADVINPYDIGAISATRAFLVHKISKFKFTDGVLIGAVIRKPSEIEEASLLPLHVVFAALHTPSAAVATAFGTNDVAKGKVAGELADLTQKVNDNTSRVKALQEGLSPSVDLGAEVYQLTCATPKPATGALINLVTGKDF